MYYTTYNFKNYKHIYKYMSECLTHGVGIWANIWCPVLVQAVNNLGYLVPRSNVGGVL
jgi:hypothetical protein